MVLAEAQLTERTARAMHPTIKDVGVEDVIAHNSKGDLTT